MPGVHGRQIWEVAPEDLQPGLSCPRPRRSLCFSWSWRRVRPDGSLQEGPVAPGGGAGGREQALSAGQQVCIVHAHAWLHSWACLWAHTWAHLCGLDVCICPHACDKALAVAPSLHAALAHGCAGRCSCPRWERPGPRHRFSEASPDMAQISGKRSRQPCCALRVSGANSENREDPTGAGRVSQNQSRSGRSWVVVPFRDRGSLLCMRDNRGVWKYGVMLLVPLGAP